MESNGPLFIDQIKAGAVSEVLEQVVEALTAKHRELRNSTNWGMAAGINEALRVVRNFMPPTEGSAK